MGAIWYVGGSYCCDGAVKVQGPKSTLRSKYSLWSDTGKKQA